MSNNPVRLFDAKGIPIESTGGALPVVDSATGTKLDATNLLLGQLAADIALIKADLAAIRAILES